MNAKTSFLFASVVTLLCFGTTRAQNLQGQMEGIQEWESVPAPRPNNYPIQVLPAPGQDPAPPSEQVHPGKLSSWITYTKPDCCQHVGGNGPIGMEIFIREGVTFPVGGGVFNQALSPGWEVQGGGRSLFFNHSMDAAWTVELSLSYMNNHGSQQGTPFTEFGHSVSVRRLHRTFGNLGLGREWYLMGQANQSGTTWRAGLDAGGRYGIARLELNDFSIPSGYLRVPDIISGPYVAVHTDLEIDMGSCTLSAGLRLEYDYMWSDVLPNNNSTLHDINLILTTGIRF